MIALFDALFDSLSNAMWINRPLCASRYRSLLLASIAALSVLLIAAPASAQTSANWPARPIRIIVGFPPGVSTDIIARLIAQKLGEANGWNVVVENKPGQAGSVGAAEAARAAPDGHTLLFSATAPIATNPNLYKSIAYDSTRDFTPITLAVDLPFVLAVNAGSPIKSVADLLAQAKAKPGAINYATPGNGTTAHLITAMFATQTGIALTHVPYRGSVEMLTGLLAGDVHTMFDTAVVTVPQVKAGKIRALAISTGSRLPSLPDVPTVAEAGVKGFDMAAWLGMLGPAGIAPPIVQRLNEEIIRALNLPDVRERLAGLGAQVRTSTPEQFAAFIRSELAKWGQAVRDSGAKVE